MRVHFHIPAAFVGGAETQLKYLIKYLRRLDPEYAPSITYEHAAISGFLAGIDAPRTLVMDRKGLINEVNRCSPDIFQYYTSPLAHRILPYLTKRPRVIEVVHNKNQFPGDATSYGHEYTQLAICVSPDAQDFILKHCPALKTDVIPNGVDTDVFFPLAGTRDPEPVVGFAGRLCADKGVEELLKIAPRLPCRLELVGQDFMGLAGRELPPNVSVFPHTTNPERFYARWWAFLSASPHESFGLAIAEALACGCPAVLLNCGGITAYWQDGVYGYLCNTMESIVEVVKDLTDGLAGDQLDPASADFSAEKMAAGYLAAYRGERPVEEVLTLAAPPQAARIFKPVKDRPRVQGTVLGVTPRGWYGVVRALAGCCDEYTPPDEAAHFIKKERPAVVVLGCYMDEWLPICKAAQGVGAKVVGTWHASHILNEFDAINRKWMNALFLAYNDGFIDHLATPHEGLARAWSQFGYPTDYFPNTIDTELGAEPVPKLPGLNIGILGSGQSWKNMECQIVAAAMVAGKPTIHVQDLRCSEILARFNIKVQLHPKTLSDEEYYQLLGGMTVNMCVSLSEVYSYLTAESLLLGTPVLTSSINPLLLTESNSPLTTPRFEDPVAMARQLEEIIDLGREGEWHWLRGHMLKLDEKHREICKTVMKGWT